MRSTPLLFGAVTLAILAAIGFWAKSDRPTSVPLSSVQAFNTFIIDHQRNYHSLAEREYRLGVFHANFLTIQEHNKKKKSWTMGVNQFTDLTWEEFEAAYLLDDPEPNHVFEGPAPVLGLTEKNWVKEGKVGPVKDQGRCADCYAFASTAAIESGIAVKTNQLNVLSEKEVLDCSIEYGNNGCKKGYMMKVFQYVASNKLGLLADYPYKPQVDPCTPKLDKPRFTFDYERVIWPTNMNGLIRALDHHPVAVCFDCQPTFQHYDGGVYEADPNCGEKRTHCILAAGYGTDPVSKKDYTLMKNSWGSRWGEHGFVRMEIKGGSGNCGMANYRATYIVVE